MSISSRSSSSSHRSGRHLSFGPSGSTRSKFERCSHTSSGPDHTGEIRVPRNTLNRMLSLLSGDLNYNNIAEVKVLIKGCFNGLV